MATYKVIQDIEAEDKLVGPFSLRQFIYAGIAAFCGYLSFISVMKGVPFLLALFVPPMLFCMFFAWPWSPDQPTEVWALARIRYYFKPRRRIWDQSGIKELVTITVPKKIERIYSDGLSQTEVRSRLSALADTIDSRGWIIKNSAVNLSASNTYANPQIDSSDRLIDFHNMPQEVPDVDILPADDILDEQNNPVAHQFDEMIHASTKAHREQLLNKLRNDEAQVPAASQGNTTANNYWFLNQPSPGAAQPAAQADPAAVVFSDPTVVQPGSNDDVGPVAADPTADEAALAAELKSQNANQPKTYSHLKNITPASEAKTAPKPVDKQPMPTSSDTAILNLANNNDLNVATLAREAHKARTPKQPPEDEVVIPLH